MTFFHFTRCQDSISSVYLSGCHCEAHVSHSEVQMCHAKISHHLFLYPLKLCIPYFLSVLRCCTDTFWLISPTWTVASYLLAKVSFVWDMMPRHIPEEHKPQLHCCKIWKTCLFTKLMFCFKIFYFLAMKHLLTATALQHQLIILYPSCFTSTASIFCHKCDVLFLLLLLVFFFSL
jgi:hypothetical protein